MSGALPRLRRCGYCGGYMWSAKKLYYAKTTKRYRGLPPGDEQETLDHAHARSHGGRGIEDNTIQCHRICNKLKAEIEILLHQAPVSNEDKLFLLKRMRDFAKKRREHHRRLRLIEAAARADRRIRYRPTT